ncbi:Tetratricopeptide repeat-containing protein [Natronincola peptidivorans]|uniref:Tetratricopeptide repeat-containing protein n=1 Tax=Natronincola peptidivorans TaxID=426128 RepID=A0A1I0F0G4_9FIRM|nr:tetratricopeptide repeat protein [Natronincola peptidivorans]SET50703.1 Tetratricopeptide repeat-containing protein [Natronincola peptidivorans]
MIFLIDDYLLKRTEELSFIHLKNDAQLNIRNYKLPHDGLDMPIMIEELAESIKKKEVNEVITIGSIIRGIIYLLGIDSKFKHKKEYIEFLYKANPKIEEYILFQGLQALEVNNLIKGIIYFKCLLLINPKNTNALINYGTTVLQYRDKELITMKKTYTKFTKEARDKLEELLLIKKDEPLAYYYLGFIYKDSKQFIKAKLHWEKAIEHGIEEKYKEHLQALLIEVEDMVQYEKGYEAVLAGRPQEGLPLLEELKKRYEEWWNLLFFIGLAHRQLGAFHVALQYFKRVLELKENQVDSIVELGLCYGALGEIEKSIEEFHRALALEEKNSEVLCNLAMMYFEIGDKTKAEKYINLSFDINPHDEITIACKKKITGLK